MQTRRAFLYTAAVAVLTLVIALCLTVALYLNARADRDRLRQNQSLLLHNGAVEIRQTTTGRSQASVPALTLRQKEFRQSNDTLLKIARTARIKPTRINEAATMATQTTDTIVASIRHDTAITWHTPWQSLAATITRDTLHATITTNDTLDIIVHRVPRRFLFFRFGCRQVRLDVISRNPHTPHIRALLPPRQITAYIHFNFSFRFRFSF